MDALRVRRTCEVDGMADWLGGREDGMARVTAGSSIAGVQHRPRNDVNWCVHRSDGGTSDLGAS